MMEEQTGESSESLGRRTQRQFIPQQEGVQWHSRGCDNNHRRGKTTVGPFASPSSSITTDVHFTVEFLLPSRRRVRPPALVSTVGLFPL